MQPNSLALSDGNHSGNGLNDPWLTCSAGPTPNCDRPIPVESLKHHETTKIRHCPLNRYCPQRQSYFTHHAVGSKQRLSAWMTERREPHCIYL
jgi:hypothetical protein